MSSATDTSDDTAQTAVPVLPRPQSFESSDGHLRLNRLEGIVQEGADGVGCDRLTALIEQETGRHVGESQGDSNGPVIRVSVGKDVDGANGNSEAYSLRVSREGVRIEAPTATGVHYAAQTLVGLVRMRDDEFVLPACEVRDWPRHEVRSVMVDPARRFIPVDRLYEIVDKMARAKLNRLHLHLLDNEGYSLESAAYPELNEAPDGSERPTYSADEMAALVEYAAERDITVLPEIDVPGHALHVVTKLPELRCEKPDDVAIYGPKPAICLGKEASYEFVETLVDEVCEIFPAEVVHLGTDEWSHYGVSWTDCADCQSYVDENGIEDVQGLYYDFLHRANDIVSARDRTMAAWNDQINISESPDIPEDIQIQFWTVPHPPWGPDFEGNSMDRFLEEGYDVVNHHTAATYLNGIKPDRLLDWNPTRFPEASEEHASGVLGGGLAIWEGVEGHVHQYQRRAIPSAVPLFADRVWNGRFFERRDGLGAAVTRHVLGPQIPDGYDVYADLGGPIFPRPDGDRTEKADLHASLAGRDVDVAVASYDANLERLRELGDAGQARFPDAIEAYVDAYEWLIEAVDRYRRGVSKRPD